MTRAAGGQPAPMTSEQTPPGGGQDTGGAAHTTPEEGHPAGEGPRSDREAGGPTSGEGQEGSSGTEAGAHGDRPTEGFDSHS